MIVGSPTTIYQYTIAGTSISHIRRRALVEIKSIPNSNPIFFGLYSITATTFCVNCEANNVPSDLQAANSLDKKTYDEVFNKPYFQNNVSAEMLELTKTANYFQGNVDPNLKTFCVKGGIRVSGCNKLEKKNYRLR